MTTDSETLYYKIAVKKNTLLLFILIGGILLSVVLVFQKQIFQQNASVATLSSFAIRGTVFLDPNMNGAKDAGEVNYTGTAKPLIRLALFAHVCAQKTPTPTSGAVTPTAATRFSPTPTLAPNCRYGLCPKVACIEKNGQVICPACEPICTTPTPLEKGSVISQAPSTTSSEITEKDVQDIDSCGEKPVGVTVCTVNPDGTYACIVNGTTFSRASLVFNPPAGYELTNRQNPYIFTAEKYQSSPSAVVDFGIVLQGAKRQTPTSPNASSQGCIPRPACLDIHQCTYPTPPQGWCSTTGKPLTNDEVNRLLIYLNTLLRHGR